MIGSFYIEKKIEDIWFGRVRISYLFMHTNVRTIVYGAESRSGIQPWWWLQCDPITARGFIAMISSGIIIQFCEPSMTQGGEIETSSYGAWSSLILVVNFTRILEPMVWLSYSA